MAYLYFLRFLRTVGTVDHVKRLGLPNAPTNNPTNRREFQANPQAYAATYKEGTRLRNRKAWDESSVREWSDVAAEERWTFQEVHMGMLFGFVVEKNPDLPEGDPRRKL